MATITLRDYVEFIDDKINSGHIDEALTHIKHVLRHYPKHVDTYRLMAKALVERDRYLDAADVFQRVLSVIPDDFLSHVGMSMVHEDGSSLSEAIWHMERAFAITPSNDTIKRELERLYLERDRVVPSIRLTRAALARMYLRGYLYDQTIAETQAAIQESDGRNLSLETLLLMALWQAGSDDTAEQVADQLLAELPYHMLANRVKAVLAYRRDGDEQSVYRQRLKAVDPYTEHLPLDDRTLTTEGILADRVTLSHLDETAVFDALKEADNWTESSGFRIENSQPSRETPDDGTPDWLREASAAAGAAQLSGSGRLRSVADAEDQAGDIPDWMRPTGAEAPGTYEQPGGSPPPDWLNDASAASDDAPPEPDVAPGWLQDMESPAAENETALSSDHDNTSEELPDWMFAEENQPNNDPQQPDWQSGLSDDSANAFFASASDSDGSSDAPDWMSNPDEDDDLPDWFKAATAGSNDYPAESDDSPEPARPAATPDDNGSDDLPDWMIDPDDEARDEPAPIAKPEAVPDWMASAEDDDDGDDFPDWTIGPDGDANDEPAPTAEPDATPDWMASAEDDDDGDDLPDWMIGPDEDADDEPATAPDAVPDWMASAKDDSDGDDLPDWMIADTPATSIPPARPPASSSASELPDWLAEADDGDDDLPDWMTDEPVAPAGSTSDLPAFMKDDTPVDTDSGDMLAGFADDELPDWMRDDSKTIQIPPDEADALPWRSPVEAEASPEPEDAGGSDLPEFLRDAGWEHRDPEIGLDDLPPVEYVDDEGDDDATGLAPAEIPDWLQALKPVEADEAPPEPARRTATGNAPDWLRAAMEGDDAASDDAPAAADVPETPDSGDFDWATGVLETLEDSAGDAPADDDASGEFSWMTGSLDALERSSGETPAEPGGDEEFSWMTGSLDALDEGAGDDNLDLPDWLQDDELPAAPATAEAPAEVDFDLPDWLTDDTDDTASGDEGAASDPDMDAAVDDLMGWLTEEVAGDGPMAESPTPDFEPLGFTSEAELGTLLAGDDDDELSSLLGEPGGAGASSFDREPGDTGVLGWLQSEPEEPALDIPAPPESVPAMLAPALDEENIEPPPKASDLNPDEISELTAWLAGEVDELAETSSEAGPASTEVPTDSLDADVLSWLEAEPERAAPPAAPEADSPLPDEASAGDAGASDNLEDIATAWLTGQFDTERAALPTPETEPVDDVSWMASIADEPAVPPTLEQATETDPDIDEAVNDLMSWLQDKVGDGEPDTEQAESPASGVSLEAAPTGDDAAEDDLAWLTGPLSELEQPTEEAPQSEGDFDWLAEMGTTGQAPTLEDAQETDPEMDEAVDDLLGWLEGEVASASEADLVAPQDDASSAAPLRLTSPDAEVDNEEWLEAVADDLDDDSGQTFAWLDALEPPAGADDTLPAAEPFVDEDAEPEDTAAWLNALSKIDTGDLAPPPVDDEDAAFSWLDDVADDLDDADAPRWATPAPRLGGTKELPADWADGESLDDLGLEELVTEPDAVVADADDVDAEDWDSEVDWRARRRSTAATDTDRDALSKARNALATGNLEQATRDYTRLIKADRMLHEIIGDLEQYSRERGHSALILRTLGDAYMHNDQLQQALDTYQQALGNIA